MTQDAIVTKLLPNSMAEVATAEAVKAVFFNRS